MTFLIIAGVIIFIIYLFQSDINDAKIKNIRHGGLATRFPNFITYTKQAYTTTEPFLQFVKDDGRYLEYRFPVKVNNYIAGYYYLGIESVFGTFAYVYAISSNGKKINGYMREIHNGRNNSIPSDQTVEAYKVIFDTLIIQMEMSKDFMNSGIESNYEQLKKEVEIRSLTLKDYVPRYIPDDELIG